MHVMLVCPAYDTVRQQLIDDVVSTVGDQKLVGGRNWGLLTNVERAVWLLADHPEAIYGRDRSIIEQSVNSLLTRVMRHRSALALARARAQPQQQQQ